MVNVSQVQEVTTPMSEIKITAKSLEVFLAYDQDAPNWSGTPLVGGNVGGSKEERGNLTHLKKAGLITTSISDGMSWVSFTEVGAEFAAHHGVDLGQYEPTGLQKVLREARMAAAAQAIENIATALEAAPVDELANNGVIMSLRDKSTGKVLNVRVINWAGDELVARPVRVKTGEPCGAIRHFNCASGTDELGPRGRYAVLSSDLKTEVAAS